METPIAAFGRNQTNVEYRISNVERRSQDRFQATVSFFPIQDVHRIIFSFSKIVHMCNAEVMSALPALVAVTPEAWRRIAAPLRALPARASCGQRPMRRPDCPNTGSSPAMTKGEQAVPSPTTVRRRQADPASPLRIAPARAPRVQAADAARNSRSSSGSAP